MASTVYVSVSEAARILDKPYYHVHRLIRIKRLKARKVGWGWIVRRSSVERLKSLRETKLKK